MRYPEFLKENQTIGLVSPSFGVSGFPYEDRFAYAVKLFEEKGYQIKMCPSIYGIKQGASNTPAIRGKELMDMYLDQDTDALISVAGGEIMCEILPYLDFNKIATSKPKYYLGYSDNTNFIFPSTVLADTAAIYGYNFSNFGMSKWDVSLNDTYDLLTGNKLEFDNYPFYDNCKVKSEDPLAPLNLNTPIQIRSLSNHDEQFTGRLVGGCLDCLQVLCGTIDLTPFQEKYQKDGFIWFMEACDLNTLGITRALWQLKNNGWFKFCKGFIFGRPANGATYFDVSFRKAISDQLRDLHVPVVYGLDFGHVPPSWPIISGALATVTKEKDHCHISYTLK